jgi:hypothetical protein
VKEWKEAGGDDYQLSAVNGVVKVLGSNHGIY